MQGGSIERKTPRGDTKDFQYNGAILRNVTGPSGGASGQKQYNGAKGKR